MNMLANVCVLCSCVPIKLYLYAKIKEKDILTKDITSKLLQDSDMLIYA